MSNVGLGVISQAIALGLAYSLLGVLIVYAIARTRYFSEALSLAKMESFVLKPRSKGEYRRFRKEYGLFKRTRRRLIALFTIHVSVFIAMYLLMIYTSTIVFRDNYIVKLPIPIPLLSWRSDDGYNVWIYTLSLISFLTPIYLYIRVTKK